MIKVEIPMKLPSLNEYIAACKIQRGRWNGGNQMKRDTQNDLAYFLNQLPIFTSKVKIHFTWIDKNRKRDIDNVGFAKKFILDALQECGKLKNDNRQWVEGFTDTFKIGDDYKVILEIEEV